MKLYATTTSERASKGQGGNEYLHIDMCINSKEVTHTLKIQPNKTGAGIETGTYHIALKEKHTNTFLYAGYTKGNQKKGLCDYCEKNRDDISSMLSNGYYVCRQCAKEMWGKKIEELETMQQVHERESKGNQKKGEKLDYHDGAKYIDCKKSDTDYCDKCGYTNR